MTQVIPSHIVFFTNNYIFCDSVLLASEASLPRYVKRNLHARAARVTVAGVCASVSLSLFVSSYSDTSGFSLKNKMVFSDKRL